MGLIKIILFCFFALFFTSCTNNKYYDPTKAHHTKEGFKNLYIDDNAKKGGFFKYFRMKFFGDDVWANHEKLSDQIEIVDVDLKNINAKTFQTKVTWLGHVTFLIQNRNLNILTDPVFSNRASPFSFMGPKRYVKHSMDYEKLPKIDYIFITHNHYDHLDIKSLKSLYRKNNRVKFFVPLGIKELLVDNSIDENLIMEFDWHDQKRFDNIYVKALPIQHWSARGLFDRRDTLWTSWYIDLGDFNFWFAGDTGYNNVQFKEIGEELKQIDLAFIPIGAYAPRWFMKYYHINVPEAVKIHQEVNAKKSIGIHWGTFPLTAEEPNDPKIKLEEELKKQNINKNDFITMKIGETLEF